MKKEDAIKYGKELYTPKSTYTEKMIFIEKLVGNIFDYVYELETKNKELEKIVKAQTEKYCILANKYIEFKNKSGYIGNTTTHKELLEGDE